MTTNQLTSECHPPLSPAEVRLLLLLSRPALNETQHRIAASLVPQVTNWPAFIDTAYRKFVLPMVYQHLAGMSGTQMPLDALDGMRALSMRVTIDMLRIQAAFDWFHEQCVLPSGVDYIYFKGPALAARFYPDPMMRFFRDIDILVPESQRIHLLRRARDMGCQLDLDSSISAEITDCTNDDLLAEFLSVTLTPQIVTPQGVLVELHKQIDQDTNLFDTGVMLSSAIEVATPRHKINTLSDTAHATFAIYHHTRHVWSKLNWLADLNAIFEHSNVDRNSVLDYARSLKLEATVAAALELHDLTAAGLHPSDSVGRTPGVQVLQICIAALPGDKELETELRKHALMNALVFGWQGKPMPLWRRTWIRISLFKPSYEDLRRLPGGRRLWHLRYTVALGMRLWREASKRLAPMPQR